MFPAQLTDGYRAFLDDRFIREQERFEDLAQSGQKPQVMIIGCCDSRVSPETIFNARPGEMFVARNVGALIPPYEPDNQLAGTHHGTSAALEFAVEALHVEHIVVLGHARCGAMRAFADDSTEPLSSGDFIGRWIRLVLPAAERTGGRGVHETLTVYVERLALASVESSLGNLRSFPWIKELEDEGKLQLHGAYFDVATGVLMVLEPSTGRFMPAVATMPKRVSMIRCV